MKHWRIFSTGVHKNHHVNFMTTLSPHPEELLGWSRVQSSVGNLCLFGEVLSALNGGNHSFHSQEGGQVGSVRGNDDKSEEPPHTTNYAAWKWPAHNRRERPRHNYSVKQSGLEFIIFVLYIEYFSFIHYFIFYSWHVLVNCLVLECWAAAMPCSGITEGQAGNQDLFSIFATVKICEVLIPTSEKCHNPASWMHLKRTKGS